MMTPAIEFDRKGLVLVVRFHRGATEPEFDEYLATYTKTLEAEARLGVVFVTAPTTPMPPARQVRLQAAFMKDYRALIEQRIVGIAFSLPSPLMRGVLRGILMIQPMPCPHTVLGTEAEGVAWLKARLWTDHVRRMKGAAP